MAMRHWNGCLILIAGVTLLLPLRIEDVLPVGERVYSEVERGKIEVPVEDVHNALLITRETENVRQVLRIVDMHYVQRERLSVVRMLRGGFDALAKELSLDVEFSEKSTDLLQNRHGKMLVSLCPAQAIRFVFCKAAAFNKETTARVEFTENVQLAAKESSLKGSGLEMPPLQRSSPLVRVGQRIFYSPRSPDSGFRFVESFSRPLLHEISKQTSVPAEKILHTFVNGMLDELDPHTSFLNSDEYLDLRRGTRGQFGGVGLVIDEVFDLALVREIVPNSPAQMAGIEPGDVILRVGELVTAFQSVDTVVKEIRQATGDGPTPVWLFRPSSKRVFRVFLTREEIPTRSVESRMVAGRSDVLFVRVTGFSSRTAEDIYAAYEEAQLLTRKKLKLFVLDLRGNPGGLLDQAVQVANLFTHSGKIVSTKSRYDEQIELANQGQKIDLPLVVLVNSSSASASEIVAGALKDQGRGLIVGERTFGKGSVQSLFELGGGAALKLTMAYYFTPSGRSIQSLGVDPHVWVKLVEIKDNALWMSGASEPEREEDLALHLENPLEERHLSQAESRFGEETGPVVWAHTTNYFGGLGALDSINFSYPSFENAQSSTDPRFDPVARIGLVAADEMFFSSGSPVLNDERIKQVAAALQKREVNTFRASASLLRLPAKRDAEKSMTLAQTFEEFFLPGAEAKIARMPQMPSEIPSPLGPQNLVLEPVKPQVNSWGKRVLMVVHHDESLRTGCCRSETYAFALAPEAVASQGKTEVSTLVGMRLEDTKESPVVWAPALLRREKGGVWHGQFHLPEIFRSYLSKLNQDGGAFVSFYVKGNVSAQGLCLGTLPLERLAEETKSLKKGRPFVLIHPQEGKAFKNPLEHQYKIKLTLADVQGSDSDYELVMIPLVDSSVRLANSVVPLRRNERNSLQGEFEVNVSTSAPLVSGFGGVIAAVLRNKQGGIAGKWPVLYFYDGQPGVDSRGGRLLQKAEAPAPVP
jgi:carboxyl-terminal processing protease